MTKGRRASGASSKILAVESAKLNIFGQPSVDYIQQSRGAEMLDLDLSEKVPQKNAAKEVTTEYWLFLCLGII